MGKYKRKLLYLFVIAALLCIAYEFNDRIKYDNAIKNITSDATGLSSTEAGAVNPTEDPSLDSDAESSESQDQTSTVSDTKSQESSSQGNSEEAGEKNYKAMNDKEIDAQFYIKKIDDDIFNRIEGKSYKDDCTVPIEDLRYIHLLHKDLDSNILEGEMICNVYIADDVKEIFRELYDADYPIERVQLVDDYDADDELSMEANNSSAFNFRFISHTNKVSKHGLGLAVDINTLYNPYVKQIDGRTSVEPKTAEEYVDRTKDFPYKIDEDDLAYKLFTEHGFEWGGSWSSVKDYQHFEIPDAVISKLYPDEN